MKKQYGVALMRLLPNVKWTVQGDDYENIIFEDSSIIAPTLAELNAELEKMKLEEDQRAINRQLLLERLGITEEEARLLLGGN